MRPTRPPIRATGPPRLDPERPVPDVPRDPDRLWTRLYIRGVDDDLEKLHGFRPGGYNPIHLQDELYDGQYRVIHKLGHGRYSTVWLCQDQHANTPSYVAVKILIASEATKGNCGEVFLAANLTREGQGVQQVDKTLVRQHLCRPLKQFLSQSPNGTHICLVYPVLGPTVRDVASIFDGQLNAIETLQDISRQSVSGLAALHSRGICHGGM
jgi:serine/threonine-protein kinase SRPK3